MVEFLWNDRICPPKNVLSKMKKKGDERIMPNYAVLGLTRLEAAVIAFIILEGYIVLWVLIFPRLGFNLTMAISAWKAALHSLWIFALPDIIREDGMGVIVDLLITLIIAELGAAYYQRHKNNLHSDSSNGS